MVGSVGVSALPGGMWYQGKWPYVCICVWIRTPFFDTEGSSPLFFILLDSGQTRVCDRITSCSQSCLKLTPHCRSHFFMTQSRSSYHLHVLGMLGCVWHSRYVIVPQEVLSAWLWHSAAASPVLRLHCEMCWLLHHCVNNMLQQLRNSLPERPFGPAVRTSTVQPSFPSFWACLLCTYYSCRLLLLQLPWPQHVTVFGRPWHPCCCSVHCTHLMCVPVPLPAAQRSSTTLQVHFESAAQVSGFGVN